MRAKGLFTLPLLVFIAAAGACTTTTGSSPEVSGVDASQDAAGSGGSSGAGGSGAVDGSSADAPPPPSAGLSVRGNKIVNSDGTPFRGRGANLHDTRSCNACTWSAPNPRGLMAWSDELLDRWHANFVRFLLTAYESSEGRAQWRGLLDDPQYYADIQAVVDHMTAKRGVYVMVTLFTDPTMEPRGTAPHAEWPTEATLPVYRKLAEAFYDNPKVLFGLMNEPHDPPANNSDLAEIFNKAIEEIRTVERARGVPEHIIVAQAPQNYARDLTYWLSNPLTAGGGTNIAYEVHPYNREAEFDALVVQPAKRLPVIIGEFGPAGDGSSVYMTESDAEELMRVAEANDIPYLAWSFHQRCPPNLLEDEGQAGYDGCGFVGAGTVYRWPPTAWGTRVKNRLAQPW
jgi:endoglucanase